MKTPNEGYPVRQYPFPTKRYCQTLDLKDDPKLIEEYKKRHCRECRWPEITEGIREVGILEMDIYILGNRLFMIVETAMEFEWDTAFEKLATLPRQAEWEKYMSIFQIADPEAASNEKWKLMERMFNL